MVKPFSTEDSLTLPDLKYLDLGDDDPLLYFHRTLSNTRIYFHYISNESERSRRNFV
jgi:hypothetical protein